MSIIKNFIILLFITTFVGQASAEEMKKMGTHKDWETYVMNDEKGKVCFAKQTLPFSSFITYVSQSLCVPIFFISSALACPTKVVIKSRIIKFLIMDMG